MARRETARPPGIPSADFDLIIGAAQAISSREPALVDRVVREQLDAAHRGFGYASNALEVSAFLGRPDTALEIARAMYLGEGFRVGLVRFSVEQGEYTQNSHLRCSILFRSPAAGLRADPRFAALCRDMGLEDYWRTTGRRPDYQRGP
jgi:hypothetical protein